MRSTQTNNNSGRIDNHGGNNLYGASFNGPVSFGAASHVQDPGACLRALKCTDPRIDRQEIESRKDDLLRDTCAWLTEDNAFQAWWKSDTSRIFWLHGDPGKGKTMMMMALIDEVEKRLATTPKDTIASQFCQSTNDTTNSAASILRGLIYLLMDKQKQLCRHVQQKYTEDGEHAFEGAGALYRLWDTLRTMVSDADIGTVYLLVDAVDECDNNQDELLQLMTRESSQLPRNVKWLVSSRNEARIQWWFLEHTTLSTSLEVNSARVSHAVAQYIDVKVSYLQQKKTYNEELRDFVRQYLSDNADGTFLWVALVCKSLAHPNMRVWKTREEMQSFPLVWCRCTIAH